MFNSMDMLGHRFGRLVVIKEGGRTSDRHIKWLCKCDCDTFVEIKGGNLRNGRSTSCGCFQKEDASNRFTTHGLRNHKLHSLWSCIKHRCYKDTAESYEYYGGRGITMHKEWKNDFMTFYDWAIANGWKKGLTIDRTNNDGNYEPDNCRFVTNRQNSLNRRLLSKSNTSGYVGVTWHKGTEKWSSRIMIRGRERSLGIYLTKEEALEARNNFIIEKDLQEDYKIQFFCEQAKEMEKNGQLDSA